MKSYKTIIDENREWIDETFRAVDKKLSAVAVRSRDKIVDGVGPDGKTHKSVSPAAWTSGFWGGMNVLMYEHTKNEDYKLSALRIEEKQDKAFEDVTGLHHDVGFMWHILSGANYRLTGDRVARNRNLLCAMTLASRFKLNGNYIRAWNGMTGDGRNSDGWTIIDCMMNLPLLYWASEELGDDRFKQIAMAHADTAMNHHVRPDGSVNHIVVHNLETGEMIGVHGGQGYSGSSCWTRGEGWALYGYMLSYIHTKEQRYLDTAKRLAHYTIAALAESDFVVPADFRSPAEPIYYDSTAASLFACGLIELAKAVPEYEKKTYLTAAFKILKVLDERFCDYSDDCDAIVMKGSEAYYGGQNMAIVYGDYFFTEAILKLKGSEFLPW
jgi:unsaturated chondroitin disaccharide hydrolase